MLFLVGWALIGAGLMVADVAGMVSSEYLYQICKGLALVSLALGAGCVVGSISILTLRFMP